MIQTSLPWWMSNPNILYPLNRILLSNKKEWFSDTCNNMDESQKHFFWKVAQSCLTLCNPMDCPWNSPSQNTGVGSRSLLHGIFPTQGSNSGLPHCRWILYPLSHQGSPRILEWVVYPFSSRSFQPRNWTGVSCIAGRFFTSWATREAPVSSTVC